MTLFKFVSNYRHILNMTPFIKKKDIKHDWLLINAENIVVGRLATYISKALRGKNKSTFNPHIDNGDFVIVTNIDKIKFSGKKFSNKIYYKHTGHPGGIKEITPEKLKEKNKSEDIIKKAIKGMLPNSPLFRDLMKNSLKLYKDNNHPHESQKPNSIDFKSLNRKNSVND